MVYCYLIWFYQILTVFCRYVIIIIIILCSLSFGCFFFLIKTKKITTVQEDYFFKWRLALSTQILFVRFSKKGKGFTSVSILNIQYCFSFPLWFWKVDPIIDHLYVVCVCALASECARAFLCGVHCFVPSAV